MAQSWRGREKREVGLTLLPSCLCCCTRNIRSFFGGKAFRTSLTAFRSAFAFGGWMPLGFAHRVFGFANGDVENLFRKLSGIARTFGHEASIAHAAPSFYGVKIQTDTLPERSEFIREGMNSQFSDVGPAPGYSGDPFRSRSPVSRPCRQSRAACTSGPDSPSAAG